MSVPANVIQFNSNIRLVNVSAKKPKNNNTGRKQTVDQFEIEDAAKILRWYIDTDHWIHYLLFVMGCNMARRCGDLLALTWEHIFDPHTKSFRNEIMEFREEKTDKLANPCINNAVRAAVTLYMEKTGCNPSDNNYKNPVFLQLSGSHAGKVLSYSGAQKMLKKAAKTCGINYNVNTHSMRKSFGYWNRMLHPDDPNSLEYLRLIFNHSDDKVTRRYIGLTKKKTKEYYDDVGKFFTDCVIDEKAYESIGEHQLVTLASYDLRDIIKSAFESGKGLAAATEEERIEELNNLYNIAETLLKH